jgi:hypothetical protein
VTLRGRPSEAAGPAVDGDELAVPPSTRGRAGDGESTRCDCWELEAGTARAEDGPGPTSAVGWSAPAAGDVAAAANCASSRIEMESTRSNASSVVRTASNDNAGAPLHLESLGGTCQIPAAQDSWPTLTGPAPSSSICALSGAPTIAWASCRDPVLCTCPCTSVAARRRRTAAQVRPCIHGRRALRSP